MRRPPALLLLGVFVLAVLGASAGCWAYDRLVGRTDILARTDCDAGEFPFLRSWVLADEELQQCEVVNRDAIIRWQARMESECPEGRDTYIECWPYAEQLDACVAETGWKVQDHKGSL